jgi:hypothetical protein
MHRFLLTVTAAATVLATGALVQSRTLLPAARPRSPDRRMPCPTLHLMALRRKLPAATRRARGSQGKPRPVGSRGLRQAVRLTSEVSEDRAANVASYGRYRSRERR